MPGIPRQDDYDLMCWPRFSDNYNCERPLRYSRPMLTTPQTVDKATTALFLDVDGTLLELRDHPDDVRSDPSLIGLLQRAERAVDGALSLISGRSIAEIDRIFAPVRFPAAGAHGAELRFLDDAPVTAIDAALPEPILDELRDFVAQNDGLILEKKRGGASLHYRRAPELERPARRLVNELLARIDDEFRLIDGKMVLELAPRQHNKGEAIREILQHAPFRDRRPVFVGDDVTDEDGFEVVNSLGGTSIRVGSGRDTAAQYQLDNVAGVQAWLRSIVDPVR